MLLLQEFKQFAMRGNVIDLAVGVIIGAAFGRIVTALVNDIITPLINVALGNISIQKFVWHGFALGDFLQTVIDFLIISVIIFILVKIINSLEKKKQTEEVPATPPRSEQLLVEIRDLLKNQTR